MFTQINRPTVEESLAHQMELIVKETTKVYGYGCTIILAGGFGRGEGSVRITVGGQALPLHDYDLFIITDQKVSPEAHRAMEKKILLDLSDFTDTDLVVENFVIGMQVVPLKALRRLPPDISTVEMKIASTVLHGPDLRPLIPVNQSDVALGSGVITLFHRATALLKNVEPEYLVSGQYPPSRALEAVYECCKVYTEICTAFSILGGFYEPSYRLRANNFQSHYHLFPGLQGELPNLGEKILSSTNMKLRSDFSTIINTPMETWKEARKALEISMRHFLSEFLKIEMRRPWPKTCQQAETRLRWLFFYDYLAFYLARLGVRGSPFVYTANFLLQIFDSFSFWRKLQYYPKNRPRWPVSLTSPILNVYLASALVLFSLLDDGTIDRELLKASKRHLHKVMRTSKWDSLDSDCWKEARSKCVEGQKLYFGLELQKRGII